MPFYCNFVNLKNNCFTFLRKKKTLLTKHSIKISDIILKQKFRNLRCVFVDNSFQCHLRLLIKLYKIFLPASLNMLCNTLKATPALAIQSTLANPSEHADF